MGSLFTGFRGFIVGIIGAVVALILWRVYCEIILIVFRIHAQLAEIGAQYGPDLDASPLRGAAERRRRVPATRRAASPCRLPALSIRLGGLNSDPLAPYIGAMIASRPFTNALELLRTAKLRPTRQRLALARLLFEKGDRHVTAEQLHGEAQAASVPVSLATIDNTLHQFIEARLLREVVVNWAGPISTPTSPTTITSFLGFRPASRTFPASVSTSPACPSRLKAPRSAAST